MDHRLFIINGVLMMCHNVDLLSLRKKITNHSRKKPFTDLESSRGVFYKYIIGWCGKKTIVLAVQRAFSCGNIQVS